MATDHTPQLTADYELVRSEHDGQWAHWIDGGPTHGLGDSDRAAHDDLMDALHDYAQDWEEDLHDAVNHAGHEPLVRWIQTTDTGHALFGRSPDAMTDEDDLYLQNHIRIGASPNAIARASRTPDNYASAARSASAGN